MSRAGGFGKTRVAMPIHDWTRVDAGIFHAFHHGWISVLSNALNEGLLPDDYYALPEQRSAGFGPDVLTLQGSPDGPHGTDAPSSVPPRQRTGTLVAAPQLAPTAETDLEFYRRKQTRIAVRHVSGDRVAAMIEIVSPGNKSGRKALRAFVEKATELLEQGIHLLIVDLFPPGPRDPQGIHAAIWEELAGQAAASAADAPLTLAAYEAALAVRAYVRTVSVGTALPAMPLFLEPNGCVTVPLEETYQSAFAAMPRRWRSVLEPAP